MKKKGFTLIELLGVLVLLAVIALIAFLVIDRNVKSGKEKMYQKQIETIELAAKNWGSDNLDNLPDSYNTRTITLLTLKMLGYVDVNISNPITGECFSNSVEVKITNDGQKISYQVDETTVTYGSCTINSYSTLEPTVTVEATNEYFSIDGYTLFTIYSNMPNLNTDKISLDVSVEGVNVSINKGDEEKIENGYSRWVSVRYDSPENLEGDVIVTLTVKEGAITTEDGKESPEVSSSILVDITPPQIIPYFVGAKCDAGSNCHTFMDPYTNNWQGCIEEMGHDKCVEYYSNGHYCMDEESISADINNYYRILEKLPYKASYVAKFNIKESSGFYKYSYCVLSDSDYNCFPGHGVSDFGPFSTDVMIDLSSRKNGKITLNVEDNFGNVSNYEFSMNNNDCAAPVKNDNINDNTLLKDYFVDKEVNNNISKIGEDFIDNTSSNVSFLGAVLSGNSEYIVDMAVSGMNWYDIGFFSDILSIENANWIFYDYHYEDTNKKYYRDYTLKEAKDKAEEDIKQYGVCGQTYYLNIFGMDDAANMAYDVIEVSVSCPPSISDWDGTGELCTESTIDGLICLMKENSEAWWQVQDIYNSPEKCPAISGCYELGEDTKDALNHNNLYNCDKIIELGGSCIYDKVTGVYYDENGNPLYTIDVPTSSE